MKSFKFGIVRYFTDDVPVIEKERMCVGILTNFGPYGLDEVPVRLELDLDANEKVVDRRTQRYYSNYGEPGEQSAPYWDLLRHKPSETDLDWARRTIINTQNGAYGKIDVEMQVFLKKILLQILT